MVYVMDYWLVFFLLIFAIASRAIYVNPEFGHTLQNNGNGPNVNSNMAGYRGADEGTEEQRPNDVITTFSNIQLNSTIYSILINLLFGVTLGLFSSFLSTRFGSRYRCPACDISFSRIDILQSHLKLVTWR